MALRDLSMKELRALIDRQLAAREKAAAEVRDYDALLNESLAEFMRRTAEGTEGAAGDHGNEGGGA